MEVITQWSSVASTGLGNESFEGGSIRDSRAGKGRFDLISPIVLQRLACHFENGANKYSERNWELGQPLSRYYDSAMRHLNSYLMAKLLGKEIEEDHLAAAMWNIHCIIHTEQMILNDKLGKDLDDFYSKTKS